MKDTYFTLIKNERIAHNTYLSVLKGDTSDITASGQFVNIKLDGLPVGKWRYLEKSEVDYLYRATKEGTNV